MEIKATNVSKIIDKKIILKNINLQVEPGEVFSLIGKNGAGKTTFFRLLLNIYNLSSGKLQVDGVDVTSNEYVAVRNKIGFLLDNLGLFRELTAWENLEFFHRIYFSSATSNDRKIKIAKLLKDVELYDRRDDKIVFFSRGMRQRLAFARAIVNDPKLLILDEPNRGLDVEGKDILNSYISGMRKKDCTVIINSHDLNDLQEICSKFAFIKDGVIIYCGSQEKIKKEFSECDNLEQIYKKLLR